STPSPSAPGSHSPVTARGTVAVDDVLAAGVVAEHGAHDAVGEEDAADDRVGCHAVDCICLAPKCRAESSVVAEGRARVKPRVPPPGAVAGYLTRWQVQTSTPLSLNPCGRRA